MTAQGGSPSEVIFEIQKIGEVVRVAAIHVASGTEVVVMGPATATRHDLETLALRKLEHVMGAERPVPPPNRPGKLV